MNIMEYKSLEDFFKTHDITNKEEYLIIRVVKAFKGNRSYSKKLWVNNLAEYYFKKGYGVSGHEETVIKKILRVTGLNYEVIMYWLDKKYKQNTSRLLLYKEEIIQDYKILKNLTLLSEKYQTTTTSMGGFLRSYGIDVEIRPRHQFKLTKIKMPQKLSFLGLGPLYRLQASWCDYLYKNPFNKDCTLIEEKQTLSRYNYGVAISQLMVGEKIVEEKTDYVVVSKIILCQKVSNRHQERLIYLSQDIEKYLGIKIVNLSDVN